MLELFSMKKRLQEACITGNALHQFKERWSGLVWLSLRLIQYDSLDPNHIVSCDSNYLEPISDTVHIELLTITF